MTDRLLATVFDNSAVGLMVFGFPLTPAILRTMLLDWGLIVAAIVQFTCGHLRATRSWLTLQTVPVRSTGSRRHCEAGSAQRAFDR
jgi:hypothetical protein